MYNHLTSLVYSSEWTTIFGISGFFRRNMRFGKLISMSISDHYKKIYSLAEDFLLGLDIPGINEELIDNYLVISKDTARPDSMNGVYQRILEAAQNANMRAGVIGGAIGGIDKLGVVLCDFDPAEVLKKFSSGWEEILDEIEEKSKPNGKIRRSPRSIWPRYCQTILSSAEFLSQFSNVKDFYFWVDCFDKDNITRPALPLLLEKEISGIGFALACDFLKELGYDNFAKPDVHLRDIFTALELCPAEADDYGVFKSIINFSTNAGVSPYKVDKLFWLIGSGYFYKDLHVGKEGRTGSHKVEFIAFAKNKLVA